MAKSKVRKPKPYVWVFQLGKHAKVGKKRVPSAFAKSLCYVYRADHDRYTKALLAIDEPDVPEADAELTFSAIDEFVERCELRPELYSDLEIDADEEHAQDRGFHTGATFEQAKEALAQGGFVVVRMLDPLAIPLVVPTPAEALEEALAGVERHLDLTSLDLVLGRVEAGAGLAHHADSAEYLLSCESPHVDARAFRDGVREAAPTWHPELRDTLLLLVARLAKRAPAGAHRAFLATLPAATDPRVKELLERWGLKTGSAAAPTPAKPTKPTKPTEPAKPTKPGKPAKPGKPTSAAAKPAKPAKPKSKIASRIAAIEAAAREAGVKLPRGASEAAVAAAEAKLGVSLPDEVRAFYLAHDGGPPNELACGGRELLSLAGMVSQWESWKEGFDAGDMEDDEDVEADEGVQQKWWIPAWIPVTYDFGGNNDVLDLAPDEGGARGQIVSVWHDDGSRTLEGSSFLAWLVDQEWSASEA